MEKRQQFSDVFPGLKLGKELDDLIGQTEVQKITMFKSKKKMVISISSQNLIAKTQIYKTEQLLTEFVFGRSGEACEIEEHFELSRQYNLEQLTQMYRDSFLEEIKRMLS